MTAANEALSTDKPAAVTFNTLAAAQDLRKSGLEDRQAEAIVTTISKAMSETVATKADLELQGAAIRKEMELQNAAIRAEIESLKQSMASMQDKIVIRLGALMVSMTFLLLAFGPFYIRWVMSLMASQ
jgi:hypothetical protein